MSLTLTCLCSSSCFFCCWVVVSFPPLPTAVVVVVVVLCRLSLLLLSLLDISSRSMHRRSVSMRRGTWRMLRPIPPRRAQSVALDPRGVQHAARNAIHAASGMRRVTQAACGVWRGRGVRRVVRSARHMRRSVWRTAQSFRAAVQSGWGGSTPTRWGGSKPFSVYFSSTAQRRKRAQFPLLLT